MPNKELINFIKEARKRGFDDPRIKEILLQYKWPLDEIELAFSKIKFNKTPKFKNKVTIFLDSEVLKQIEKRANKSMFTISEQIEDILRRSAVNTKTTSKTKQEKLDDMFVGLFSRKQSCKKK